MKIRFCQFAMVPLWVVEHPQVRGNPTVIAAYVGLRIVAYEYPDRNWRSERQAADAIGEVIGLSGERTRKHLSLFRQLGMLRVDDDGQMFIVDEPPGSGVGSPQTQLGSDDPHAPLTSIENTQRARGGSVEHPDFATFYVRYPRKSSKPDARRAYTKARQKVGEATILAGLDLWVAYWRARNEPQFIPEPARWLNKEAWNDDPPPVNNTKTAPGMNAVRRILSEEGIYEA